MGARKKLNSSYVAGSIVIAALVGGLTNSWLIFLLALGALIGLNWYGGDIRLQGRGR